MNPYAGNVFIDMERAMAKGSSLTLTSAQMQQVLNEVAALITKANELVRLNIALAERVEIQSGLLSKRAERES